MVGRKGPAEIRAFFDSTAAGTRHRRSRVDLVIRASAGVIVGVLGWVLDASPLLAFAFVILATIGVSEWRVRHA